MGDQERLIVSKDDKPSAEYGTLYTEDEPPKASPFISNTLKLLFFICGLSTFARSEAVLMQTSMYAKCFHLGPNFYAAASSAIFIPGILVQVIQTKWDRYFDRKYGTYKAAAFRIVLSYVCKYPSHRHLGSGWMIACVVVRRLALLRRLQLLVTVNALPVRHRKLACL